MIEGSVDVLAFNFASGWACDLDDPAEKITIRLMRGSTQLACGMADKYRNDLEHLGNGGRLAFDISYENLADMDGVAVYGESSKYAARLAVIKTMPPKYGFQPFMDQIGMSDSREKLRLLGLPERMDGLSVLDLGCNEGFFCIDALARGAEVTGIDADAEIIAKARERNQRVNYIHADWRDIPTAKYDYIYFLDGLHLESRIKELFFSILSALKPGGVLVLECGVINGSEGWTRAKTRDNVTGTFPSYNYLTHVLLKNFSVRYLAPFTEEEALRRIILHATPRQPTAILMGGASGSGKTSLASLLDDSGSVSTFSIDNWLGHRSYGRFAHPGDNPIYRKIHDKYNYAKIDEFIDSLGAEDAMKLAEAIFADLPMEADCMLLEGYALGQPDFRSTLCRLLRGRGVRIWTLEREK